VPTNPPARVTCGSNVGARPACFAACDRMNASEREAAGVPAGGSSHTLYMLVAMGERSAGEPQATARASAVPEAKTHSSRNMHLIIVHK
jgi:hypothetical protein